MTTPRFVSLRRQHPRPFSQDFPRTEQEEVMLRDWLVGMVDDLVDDSVEFIGEELIRAGRRFSRFYVIWQRMRTKPGADVDRGISLIGKGCAS